MDAYLPHTSSTSLISSQHQQHTLKRKQSNISIRSVSPVVHTEREQALVDDIKSIEQQLKDLPYLDLKVEIREVEDIVQKAVRDLVANIEEHHEIKAMVKQVERELKEFEDKQKYLKKLNISSRRREGSPQAGEDLPDSKHAAKVTVLKKLQQLKTKNEEQKVMISKFLANLCRQGKRSELEERLKLKKTELLLEKLKKEKELLENKLSEAVCKNRDENDPEKSNCRKPGKQLPVLREKDRNSISMLKNESTAISARNRPNPDLDDGKNSDISRKNSFRTNVSKRYQEADDDESSSKSNRSSSRGSCDGLSQTYSQKRAEPALEKRNTHDIKSLERLAMAASSKSGKQRELSQNQKRYFSNTGEHPNLGLTRKHKSDLFGEGQPGLDESTEKQVSSKILYKNHFVLP